MRPLPIPAGLRAAAEAHGWRTVVIGEADPTRDDVRPCEYVVRPSAVYPGRESFAALVMPDDADRERIAAGAPLWLVLEGLEVPWALDVSQHWWPVGTDG